MTFANVFFKVHSTQIWLTKPLQICFL